ncbi:unnamed protein product [Rangifer tarandus platyrhynchus]|uniref:Uncharacterized protein n=1 Tax=Rangifer tarandus platyrhynchus TaxID=3082113 RepID=A0ABN8YDS4_RANTA|nr:unnamed protein product [Rangifer tarandus platyrhynchus]
MTCTGLVEQRTLKMLMRVRSPPSTVSVVLAEAGCRSKAWCPALSQMLLTGEVVDTRGQSPAWCLTADPRHDQKLTLISWTVEPLLHTAGQAVWCEVWEKVRSQSAIPVIQKADPHLAESEPSTLGFEEHGRSCEKAFFCPWVRPCQHLTHVLRATGGLEGAATINELMVPEIRGELPLGHCARHRDTAGAGGEPDLARVPLPSGTRSRCLMWGVAVTVPEVTGSFHTDRAAGEVASLRNGG